MDLSIIIVNYKTPDLVLSCLQSLKATIPDNLNYEIIVVDNHSQDNSEQRVKGHFSAVVWINNGSNDGFGRANNMGISVAQGEYILLLNSDVIVLPDTIQKSLEYIKARKNIGALGCKLLNEDGSLQNSVYYYIGDFMGVLQNNLLVDYFFKPKKLVIKAVMGAYMLIRKDVMLNAGQFDPDFFMYAEELDLCRRISSLGYAIFYYDDVKAIHKHGASSGVSSWSAKQNYLSNALLYLKVRGVAGYFLYHLCIYFNFITNMALIWKMDKNYRRDFWQDQKFYFSNFFIYFKIPFLYSKSIGNGKRILKRA